MQGFEKQEMEKGCPGLLGKAWGATGPWAKRKRGIQLRGEHWGRQLEREVQNSLSARVWTFELSFHKVIQETCLYNGRTRGPQVAVSPVWETESMITVRDRPKGRPSREQGGNNDQW
jgi:hypothetical protein